MQIIPQQIQRQILAPLMQQSIEILMLPLLDLNLSIEQELQNNPLLEINEENPEPLSSETADQEFLRRLDDWAGSLRDLPFPEHFTDDEIVEERPVKTEVSLEDSLMRQVHVEFTDPSDIQIGECIIGNLDEDGYLKATIEEIAQSAHAADAEQVERVLSVIHGFEPCGIAGRTLGECLLIQMKDKDCENKDLVLRIIQNHLNELGCKKYRDIIKATESSLAEVKKAAHVIATLEPRPARNHRPVKAHIFIKPDVLIAEGNDSGYKIEINKEGIPSLRISARYRDLLHQKNLSPQDREFIADKLKKAVNFVRSIELRGHTLRKITEYILEKQGSFFEHGSQALVPMTLKDVAQAIGRNESTISRAVQDKFVDTPQGGILAMKFFFSQGLPETDNGTSVASRSVKEEIKTMIREEDKSSPLSDQEIQEHFTRRRMQIARRTVSKYRLGLRILPSNLRKI